MHEMGIVLHVAKTLEETAKEEHITELRIVKIPAVTFCNGCGQTYETVRYGKECPYCHSGETWLVDGNQCMIREIEAETEEEDPERT